MDGNDSFTKLLLHCDGADGSTAFANSAIGGAAAVTAVGTAQVDTAQSVFGGASALLGAAGNYLSAAASADWNLGSGNFAIDFRVRFTGITSGAPDGNFDLVLSRIVNGDSSSTIAMFLDGTDIGFFARSASSPVASYTATHGLAINTWYHLAFVRSGSSFFIFKDGVAYSLTTVTAIGSNSMPDLSAFALFIGEDIAVPGPGWIDEFRWSKGTDRGWTTNFTPPALAYGINLPVTVGTYTRTGNAAVLTPKMAEGAGAFSLVGVSALRTIGLAGGAGAYELSGQAAPLNHAVQFGAGGPGSYLLSGKNVILHPAQLVSSTETLHKPVDFALAGGQRYPVRRARLR